MVKAPASLWKTKGSLLIAWINSKQISAHFIRHLPSHPATFICHIIQSGPFRGPGAIVYTRPGFSKRPEWFLSCLDKTGWLKRRRRKSAGQVRAPISFRDTVCITFVSVTYQAWCAGHIVGVSEKVC